MYKFDKAPGLYFEKQNEILVSNANWNAITFFDASSLKTGLKTIRSDIMSAKNVCEIALQRKFGCDSSIQNMEDKYIRLNEINSLIFGAKRSKRAVLNIIGDIAGDLFGILGSQFEEQYKYDISKLSQNENHLLKLLENHTSIMESTFIFFIGQFGNNFTKTEKSYLITCWKVVSLHTQKLFHS